MTDMTDTNPKATGRRPPQRHVALALLSARDEVLLIRQAPQSRYGLPESTVDRDADDDTLTHAVAALQAAVLAEGSTMPESAWLGRFAAPDENGRLDMLEVYLTRLGELRLQPDVDFERAWAPLLSPPPDNMIDPAIELQVMPALALLIDPQAPTSR